MLQIFLYQINKLEIIHQINQQYMSINLLNQLIDQVIPKVYITTLSTLTLHANNYLIIYLLIDFYQSLHKQMNLSLIHQYISLINNILSHIKQYNDPYLSQFISYICQLSILKYPIKKSQIIHEILTLWFTYSDANQSISTNGVNQSISNGVDFSHSSTGTTFSSQNSPNISLISQILHHHTIEIDEQIINLMHIKRKEYKSLLKLNNQPSKDHQSRRISKRIKNKMNNKQVISNKKLSNELTLDDLMNGINVSIKKRKILKQQQQQQQDFSLSNSTISQPFPYQLAWNEHNRARIWLTCLYYYQQYMSILRHKVKNQVKLTSISQIVSLYQLDLSNLLIICKDLLFFADLIDDIDDNYHDINAIQVLIPETVKSKYITTLADSFKTAYTCFISIFDYISYTIKQYNILKKATKLSNGSLFDHQQHFNQAQQQQQQDVFFQLLNKLFLYLYQHIDLIKQWLNINRLSIGTTSSSLAFQLERFYTALYKFSNIRFLYDKDKAAASSLGLEQQQQQEEEEEEAGLLSALYYQSLAQFINQLKKESNELTSNKKVKKMLKTNSSKMPKYAHKIRSRNRYIDKYLTKEEKGTDTYADLEDFIASEDENDVL